MWLRKPNMWDKVLNAFRRMLDNPETTYTMKVKSEFSYSPPCVGGVDPSIDFNCTGNKNTHALVILHRTWQALRTDINEQTADTAIIGKFRTRSEERFHYNETGIPRVWSDDVDGAFKIPKDRA